MAQVGTDSYVLRMIDQITAPLRAIQAQMERVAGSMEKLKKNTTWTAIESGVNLAKMAIGGLVGVMAAGVGVGQKFVGTMMEAAKFRAQNITALDVLLGKGKGEGVFGRALDVGGITAADERDVVEQVRKLAGAGYSGGALNRVNAALLDVQALGGNESMNALSYYFAKFKGGLSFERDDLRMAAASAGIKERDLLSSMVGLTGATPAAGDFALGKQVEALKKAGRLNGEVVVEAMLQAIRSKLDEGGALGSFAKKMGSGTLAGLLSNLSAAPTRFLAQMKLESLPGIQSLMEFLKRLLVFFDHGTAQGQQLKRVVEELTTALFGGLDKLTHDALADMFRRALRAVEAFTGAIKAAWTWVDQLLNNPSASFGDATARLLREAGAQIGAGLWQSLGRSAGSAAWDTAKDVILHPAKLLGAEESQPGPGLRERLAKAGTVDDRGPLPLKLGGTTINVGGITVHGTGEEAGQETAASLEASVRQAKERLAHAAAGG